MNSKSSCLSFLNSWITGVCYCIQTPGCLNVRNDIVYDNHMFMIVMKASTLHWLHHHWVFLFYRLLCALHVFSCVCAWVPIAEQGWSHFHAHGHSSWWLLSWAPGRFRWAMRHCRVLLITWIRSLSTSVFFSSLILHSKTPDLSFIFNTPRLWVFSP